jgi:hypothetical protein
MTMVAVDVPRAAGAYGIWTDCPACGGAVEHVTGSVPTPVLNTRSSAIVRCTDPVCGRSWELVVTLAAVGRTRPRGHHGDRAPCGTERGWYRHMRDDEDPCADCKDARNRAKAEWRASRRERVA